MVLVEQPASEPTSPADRILHAALKLFARDGAERTRLADIARRAGLSKATLYHHFPRGKAAIFHEAVDVVIDQHWKRTVAKVRASGSPRAQLLTYMNLRVDEFDQAIASWGVDLTVWQTIKPWIEPTLSRYFDRERQLLHELLEAGVKDGSLAPCDPEATTVLLQAMFRGLTVSGPIETTARDRARERHALRQMLEHGLFAP